MLLLKEVIYQSVGLLSEHLVSRNAKLVAYDIKMPIYVQYSKLTLIFAMK